MKNRTTLEIERLTLGGEGVGHAGGMAVFVPYTAPGDKLEIEIVQSQKRFARGRIVRVMEPSKDRVTPPCPYHFQVPSAEARGPRLIPDLGARDSAPGPRLSCGGCMWQHLAYAAQLGAKRALVQETLERIGGLRGVQVKPVLGMKDPWRYRNKVQQPVGWDPGPDSSGKRGRLISGFYAEGSHDIVPIDDCLVQPESSVKIINRAKALLDQYGLRAYHSERHQGWIRHLLIRSSQEGKAMLVFVTRTPDFPQESKIVPYLMREFPALIGIHQNVNPGRTNVILGREWRRIYGQDFLEERLGPLKFRLSPGAFFQINSPQARVLYDITKAMAGRGERLLDLYTGVGTIALWLSDQFKYVGGVEENPAAIRDAEVNASLNNIRNVQFAAQSTESFLGGIAREPRRSVTVVLDPPRAGCAPMVLQSLLALRPMTLIYVSCDPGTLARDLAVLTGGGYQVQEVQPVDLFPHTSHIETAVKLTI